MAGVELFAVILSQWLFQPTYEFIDMPLTWRLVNALNRVEGIDLYYPDIVFTTLKIQAVVPGND